MRDIDHRRADALVQPLDLDAQLGAQLRVKVGQRLVKQKHRRLAHQSAADGDALALAARERGGPAVEQRAQAQHVGGGADPLLDFGARHVRDLQAEGHVAAHAHARIKRVGLEDHGYAAVLRLLPGDIAPADPHLPGADLDQPGDGVEQGGFAAARRPEQHEEFRLRHLKVEPGQDFRRAEGDVDAADRDIARLDLDAHPFTAPAAMPRTNQRPEPK